MRIHLILSILCFFLGSATSTWAQNHEAFDFFGAKINLNSPANIESLKESIAESDTILATLKGTIGEVCQAKGCWMTLINDSPENSVFIRFKDYGFFVPKDSQGKGAVVEGYAYYHVTSVEELRHYAHDKGATEKEISAIKSPQREIRLIANGVAIRN